MQQPTVETIEVIFRQHGQALSLPAVDRVDVAPIGQGESNLNLLVTVNGMHPFNLRIGLRDAESEQTLQAEFDALQAAEPAIGPRAYFVDFSREHLSDPYMVLDYVGGEEKKEWRTVDLQDYARTLARLHRRKYDGHGPVGKVAPDPFDFVHRLDVAVDYWRTNHPELFDIPFVAKLLPRVRSFLETRNPYFLELSRFSLVHGDAHPQNIIFSENGIRLIDWEWAAIGDPAMDVTTLGWDVSTAWQIELSGAQLEAYLAAYLTEEPDPTLRERRDAWMVYTMAMDQMYHRTQLGNDPDGRQAYTVERLEGYLTERFLR